MKNITFSLIIPVYNAEIFLKSTVNTILNQTYKNIEVILVNDGSQDQSLKIARQMAEKDARVFVVEQKNAGAAVARNNGLALAKGDYILFPDSDDYFTTLKGLEEIATLLDESHADVLFFDCIEVTEKEVQHNFDSNFRRENVFSRSANKGLENMIKANKLTRSAWTKVVNRDFLLQNCIKFPEVSQTEDTGFTADLIFYAKILDWYEKKFYAYVKHDESITAKRLSTQVVKDSEKVISYAMARVKDMEDLKQKNVYLSYMAYPYMVLLGQAKELAKRDKETSKQVIKNLKEYSHLLNYDWTPRVSMIRKFYSIFGYYLTVIILGKAMDRIYKRKGI